jgi:hypothetical protein
MELDSVVGRQVRHGCPRAINSKSEAAFSGEKKKIALAARASVVGKPIVSTSAAQHKSSRRQCKPGRQQPQRVGKKIYCEWSGGFIVREEPSGAACMLGGLWPCGLDGGAPPLPVSSGPVQPCGCFTPSVEGEVVVPVLFGEFCA